mmetsp:Transcript_36952/g.89770  ORF Transcript_36952/g.89770 Transcript_36952/m.89770 type:complete len:97 (+) Transcript_36952:1443-1733(+)
MHYGGLTNNLIRATYLHLGELIQYEMQKTDARGDWRDDCFNNGSGMCLLFKIPHKRVNFAAVTSDAALQSWRNRNGDWLYCRLLLGDGWTAHFGTR